MGFITIEKLSDGSVRRSGQSIVHHTTGNGLHQTLRDEQPEVGRTALVKAGTWDKVKCSDRGDQRAIASAAETS